MVGLAASGCSGGAEPDAATLPAVRPNVLLVVLDTVRADRLSVYGHDRPTSPNLERLAARGTRFERAHASAPWTVPSHASMFTGLTPAEHGAHHEHRALSADAVTLAEALTAAGYATAGFSANPFVGPATRLDQGFARFENPKQGAVELNERALGFVRETSQPWFLMLNYMEAHLPFPGVPDEAVLRFADANENENEKEAAPAKLLAFEEQFHAFAYSCGEMQPDPARLEALAALYDGALAYLDAQVGALLDGVREAGGETVVIVVSDHGELLGEGGQIEHQFSLAEPLLRVPLLISWPGFLPEGASVPEPYSTASLFDWVLRFSEGLRPGDAPPWQGRAPERIVAEYYRPVSLLERVAERFPNCPPRLDRRSTAVFEGDHKLVSDEPGAARLYDLRADPGETRDLKDREAGLLERMTAQARAQRARGVAALEANRPPVPHIDPETRQRLEALGYAGT